MFPLPASATDGPSVADQSLDAQAALLPQALAVFGVCLPIYVWAGSFARDAAWMSATFAVFAINWGAFYFTVQQLKRPQLRGAAVRTRIHVLSGLLWSAAVWQMAAFADQAGPARDILLLMTVGAAVLCLFFTTPSLASLIVVGPAAMAAVADAVAASSRMTRGGPSTSSGRAAAACRVDTSATA